MNSKVLYSCVQCGAQFLQWPSQMSSRAFCSKACYSNSMIGKAPPNKGKRTVIEKPCAKCGSPIAGMPSEVKRRKYCSKECTDAGLSSTLESQLARYRVMEDTGCWLWEGPKRDGYGRMKVGGNNAVTAHRASYEFHVGPIPDGLVLDHLCRNPSCINPAHLEPVTSAENIRRGDAGKGARSEAHRAALSAGGKRRFQDPDQLAKQRAHLNSLSKSEKRLAAVKDAQSDPEYRRKQSERMKRVWEDRKRAKDASD